MIVGAFSEDGMGADSGAAYIFKNDSGVWSEEAILKASNADAGDGFGFSVDLDGDRAVVGAISEQSGAAGVNGDQLDNSEVQAGAAYVFERSEESWSQVAYLKASDSEGQFELDEAGDGFGWDVAIEGETILVGACLLYTSPSPRDKRQSRMPSSA